MYLMYCKQFQVVDSIFEFNQLMTPDWIEANAEITGNHQVTQDFFEILPTTGSLYQRALRVPIVPPTILNSNNTITVMMTVALDTTIAQTDDHDPYLGISDGKSFIGWQTVDVDNYNTNPPCYSINADVGASIITGIKIGRGPHTDSKAFPTVINMRFKPAELWGTCETPQGDGGYNNLAAYNSLLNPSNGISFELYRHNPDEIYRIKYVQVYIVLEWTGNTTSKGIPFQ